MSEMIQKAFDYDGHPDPPPPHLREPVHREEVDARWDESLSPDTQEFVQKITDEIHGQLKRTAEGVIKIGQTLIAVKKRLDHGQFLSWLESEFEMKERSARNFMQVAQRFGDKSANFAGLPLSILYALAAPSTSDETVEQVLTGSLPATLEAIKAEKETIMRRADEAERAREELSRQLQRTQEEVAALQEHLKKAPHVIEKTVENPETEAELARLREKYAQMEAQLKQKTERVKVLSEEIRLHDSSNQQERYNEQIRFKWRQACDAFHLGINQAITRMVTPLDAASAFVSDDWARLAEVESTLKRALEELKGLRESVSCQLVEGSVEK